ncbi:aldolase [Trametes maxima]|nr:aldolase [Trametes maxima]
MTERPSPLPSDDFAPLPPAMPVASFRGKRRTTTDARDENGSPLIPIALSPPVSSPAGTTRATKKTSSSYLRGRKAQRPAQKSLMPFPTNSGPAPPVLTATHARFAVAACRLLNAPKPPGKPKSPAKLDSPPAVGGGSQPNAARARPRDKQKKEKTEGATSPPLWRALEAKRKVVVAETLDYELLGTLPYGASMLTPRMLQEGLLTPDTAYHAWVGAKRAIEKRHGGEWDLASIMNEALRFYLVELGASMLDRVDGPHYTFVDPRLHDDPRAMVKHALRLLRLFAEKGYGRERIVVTIPATEAGVQAAKTLESKHHVQTNLSLVSGLAHAAACAEAGATCLTLCYRELSDACGRKTTSSNPFVRAWDTFSSSPKRLAEEVIQATTAYLNLHELPSAILVANLYGASDAERLGEFDAVVFTADHSLKARAPTPGVPPANAFKVGAPAKRRAHDVQYPTSYLAAKDGGFMSAMPADARTVAGVTLAVGLGAQTKRMFETSMHMLEFIQGEAQLDHLDDIGLGELYDEDDKELNRLNELAADGVDAEPLVPVRWNDVGFRLRCSSWDVPAAYLVGHEESRDDTSARSRSSEGSQLDVGGPR